MSDRSSSPILVANWKSHKTAEEAQSWWSDVRQQLEHVQLHGKVRLVIAPPAPLLAPLAWAVNAQPTLAVESVAVAAQDVSPFPMGSYTGATAAATIASTGVKFAIVGHSERRQYFHETNQDVANKVAQLLEVGMVPIVCVDQPYLKSQLAALPDEHLAQCWFAYEPLEAIGSGLNQPVAEVEPVVAELRAAGITKPILYGGSVAADNVAEYLAVTDGVLVGRATLDAKECVQLVQAMVK